MGRITIADLLAEADVPAEASSAEDAVGAREPEVLSIPSRISAPNAARHEPVRIASARRDVDRAHPHGQPRKQAQFSDTRVGPHDFPDDRRRSGDGEKDGNRRRDRSQHSILHPDTRPIFHVRAYTFVKFAEARPDERSDIMPPGVPCRPSASASRSLRSGCFERKKPRLLAGA
jgi:hypothetical protein